MTPEERQLISDLFERLRSYRAPDKDREAEDFIARLVRQNADAPYLLVQSVLVQEQALQQSDARIQELQDRVRELEGPPQRSQGSFLGGRFGGASEPRGASVPQVGARATPTAYDSPRPWSQQAPPAAPAPAASGGGGFMRTALSAAAGVAGGMLLADGIRNMMGGHSAHAGGMQPGQGREEVQAASHEPEEDNEPEDAGQDDDPGFDGGGEMDV